MSTPTPTPVPLSKFQTFLRRLLSTVILWTVVLTAIFAGNPAVREPVLLLLVIVLGFVGLREFFALARQRGLVHFEDWGIFSGMVVILATFFQLTRQSSLPAPFNQPGRADTFEPVLLGFLFLGLCVRALFSKKNQPVAMTALSTTLLGFVYVPWLLNFIQKICFYPGIEGRFFVLYFILVTKFSDLGAYCIGSLIGRNKMIPRISPGKTWEGFGGAILVSTGVSVLFAHFAGAHLGNMPLSHSICLGAVLALGAVVGDLIESLFKREAGAKDSGRFFPGIGGILDLLDSLLFNAPIVYLYLKLFA